MPWSKCVAAALVKTVFKPRTIPPAVASATARPAPSRRGAATRSATVRIEDDPSSTTQPALVGIDRPVAGAGAPKGAPPPPNVAPAPHPAPPPPPPPPT